MFSPSPRTISNKSESTEITEKNCRSESKRREVLKQPFNVSLIYCYLIDSLNHEFNIFILTFGFQALPVRPPK